MLNTSILPDDDDDNDDADIGSPSSLASGKYLVLLLLA